MRRLLVATILGAALSMPAFAADNDTQTAALSVASTASVAAATNTTIAGDADVAPVQNFKYGRPSLLPALYATSAALQGYDAYSTMNALKHGGVEANPVMKSVVKSPVAFVALKAGVTTASIMAAEQLWKNNHRIGAIGLMVASNVMMGMVAANNARVLGSLK